MRLRKHKPTLQEKDATKTNGLKKRLWKLSSSVRRKQLKSDAVKPLKRGSEAETLPVAPPDPKTVLKVNVSGNLRGIHNRINPPTSERMRKVRAMRRFYNKQMPVLACNNC